MLGEDDGLGRDASLGIAKWRDLSLKKVRINSKCKKIVKNPVEFLNILQVVEYGFNGKCS